MVPLIGLRAFVDDDTAYRILLVVCAFSGGFGGEVVRASFKPQHEEVELWISFLHPRLLP